ncbi:AMP-binding protein [Rhodococcus hoagii]|nr:AMP-binding protein [Prescottella equi]
MDAASAVDTLAYVITTSGSTGTPKQVAVTHRGLAALAAEARRRYRVGPGDRVLHGYDPAFDAALLGCCSPTRRVRHWSSRRRTCSRERRCTIFCADSRSLTSFPPPRYSRRSTPRPRPLAGRGQRR